MYKESRVYRKTKYRKQNGEYREQRTGDNGCSMDDKDREQRTDNREQRIDTR